MNNEQTKDLQDPTTMKIKDIQIELKNMGVTYVDCFDRASIVQRLMNARRSHNVVVAAASSSNNTDAKDSKIKEEDETLNRLRSLSVKELRTECSKYNIRWATMIDKEDLVQALLNHHRSMAQRIFSLSQKIIPGHVADISGDVLAQELEAGHNMVPLLLDVRVLCV